MRWLNAQRLIEVYGHEPRCVCCGSTDVATLETDHILPRAHGGSDTPDNLQILCATCNGAKADHATCPLPHAQGNAMETQANISNTQKADGGSREGARRRRPGTPVNLSLPKDVADILAALPKIKKSEYVAKLIRADQAAALTTEPATPCPTSPALLRAHDRDVVVPLHAVLPVTEAAHPGFASVIPVQTQTPTPPVKRRWWPL